MLQEKATTIATQMGMEKFSGSNDWLEKWLTCYHVKCAVLCGENGEVKEEILQDWSKDYLFSVLDMI